jgi:dipeptidyl aminopeptidase/acylaminoacyl peptidase
LLYLTAGDEAKVKVFVLPVPPTPAESSTHPKLGNVKPIALTQTGAASGLHALPNHRIVFSRSSYTSPNDVWIIRDLHSFEESLISQGAQEFKGKAEQLTRFTEGVLKPKGLSPGEEFWFEGAEQKVQGWTLKPRGWQPNQKKAYPVVLLIHGGPQGCWEDQWSNRWNPNMFAAQGYYVLAINPTGSTTFGQSEYLFLLLSLPPMTLIRDRRKGLRMLLREIGEENRSRI